MALSVPALACDFDDENGLDVGLVLSGGGAKASTQIGVMQVMDELGIPVHCIAGTSMGAVVGSFYANGYSANQIAEILTDNDWGQLFRGKVPRRDKSFVEKEREASYYSGNIASFGADGLQLPGGLSNMQGLKRQYRQLLSDVPRDMNFDDLVIPFRSVATNLHTGDKTVFAKGDLVETILASMAVPGVFAPRIINDELYVDGGLSSNLPIQTARDMGADIIIAIDVSNAPTKPSRNISVAATASQITTIVIWQKVLEERKTLTDQDMLIEPNKHAGLGTASYELAEDGLVAGVETGRELQDQLLTIKAKAAPARFNPAAYKDLPAPESLKLVNNTIIKDTIIENRLGWNSFLSEDRKTQVRGLRDLASFGGFGDVDIGRSAGDAVLSLSKNPLGRNLIQIGLNATNDFDGDSSYSLLARITRKPLGPLGGDVSLSGELGTNLGLSAELYQPFGPKGRFFIQPELFATWQERRVNIFGFEFPDLWEREYGIRGRMGRELGSWGVVALEGGLSNVNVSSNINTGEAFKTVKFNSSNFGAYFGLDTLNRKDWPTSGQRLRASAKRIYTSDESDTSDIDQFEASWLGAFEVKGIGTLVNARYGTSSTISEFGSGSFTLGGFRQLSAFPNNSVPVDEFTFVSLEVFDRITGTGRLLDLPVYVGALVEFAELPIFFFDEDLTSETIAGSLYLGIDTPLGPAFLGGSYGDAEVATLFFKFGRTF
ncbi:MAG: patatin-like phospholipase family protein [Alphaproteobacteria bacterium]